jgi:hypothetical protein
MNPSEVAKTIVTKWFAEYADYEIQPLADAITTALTEARNEGRASTTKEERVNVQTVMAYEAGRNEGLLEAETVVESFPLSIHRNILLKQLAKLRGGTNGKV